MSTITLTFSLPDEREEASMAMNVTSYYLALHDMQELLRNYRKYGVEQIKGILDPEGHQDPAETAQNMNDHLEQEFFNILKERGIDL